MTKMVRPDLREDVRRSGEFVECPRCNAVGGCPQCAYWGWVRKDSPDAKCVHKTIETRLDMHTYRVTCVLCDHSHTVDSSG